MVQLVLHSYLVISLSQQSGYLNVFFNMLISH